LPDALPDQPADLLVANILLEPLLRHAARFAALLRPGGLLLLSGLLRDQVERCSAAYRAQFDLGPARCLDDWALVHGTRRRA
jgi:ribosomal protein L11 methyltransferase